MFFKYIELLLQLLFVITVNYLYLYIQAITYKNDLFNSTMKIEKKKILKCGVSFLFVESV